ncbi:rod shape-determining protein RodA [Candidatus Uhrbacteria bacterium]|nr:rod shape-determining protein RodA [Candidatus Uhrbacteria bacterium]
MIIEKIKKYDLILLITVLFLSSLGLSALYSIGTGRGGDAIQFFHKQLIFFAVLFPSAAILSFIHYNFFRSTSAILYLISCASLLAVLFFGDVIRGTRGWISFGPITFQPVELCKVSLILALASYFSSHTKQVHQLRHILISGMIAALPVGLVLLQPDIGSASILFFIWCAMILVSRIQKKYIIGLFVVGMIATVCAWFFVLQDYQKDRIITFVNPTLDVRDRGYNVRQAMIAIGSGQMFGKGLGSGSQSQLRFLPEAQTDFIFSVIAEEMGLFGVFLILAAWTLFFLRLFYLMKISHDDFSQFTLFGISMLFFAHVSINIGGNLGLLPLTGIVLPFLSYGGSALFMACAAIGIVQSIKLHTSSRSPIDTDLFS